MSWRWNWNIAWWDYCVGKLRSGFFIRSPGWIPGCISRFRGSWLNTYAEMSAQKGSGWSEIWKRLFTIDCRFQRDQDQWGLLLFNYLQSHIAIEPTSCWVSDSLTHNVSNKQTMLLNRPRLCKTEIHPSKLGMPAARTSGIRKRVPFLINFLIVQCLWWIWGNFSVLFLRDICGKRAPHLSLSCIPGHWWGKNLNEA